MTKKVTFQHEGDDNFNFIPSLAELPEDSR